MTFAAEFTFSLDVGLAGTLALAVAFVFPFAPSEPGCWLVVAEHVVHGAMRV